MGTAIEPVSVVSSTMSDGLGRSGSRRGRRRRPPSRAWDAPMLAKGVGGVGSIGATCVVGRRPASTVRDVVRQWLAVAEHLVRPDRQLAACCQRATMLMPFLVLTVVTVLTGSGSAGEIGRGLHRLDVGGEHGGSVALAAKAAGEEIGRRNCQNQGKAGPGEAPGHFRIQLHLLCPLTQRLRATGALEAKNMAIL